MCQFSSRPRNWATHPPRWEVDILVQLKIYLFTQVLDSRREDLEKYLQYLAKIEPLPFELSEFLNLEDLTTSSDSAGCSKNVRLFRCDQHLYSWPCRSVTVTVTIFKKHEYKGY